MLILLLWHCWLGNEVLVWGCRLFACGPANATAIPKCHTDHATSGTGLGCGSGDHIISCLVKMLNAVSEMLLLMCSVCVCVCVSDTFAGDDWSCLCVCLSEVRLCMCLCVRVIPLLTLWWQLIMCVRACVCVRACMYVCLCYWYICWWWLIMSVCMYQWGPSVCVCVCV